MKKTLSLSITILLILLSFAITVFANGISVSLNGNYIDFADQQPTIVEGRTLVPLRAIFEALGASVEWDSSTSTVTSKKGITSISLTIGSNVMQTNGTTKIIDVPAQIMNGRTMVPARAIAETYGVKVDWDSKTQTVILTENNKFNISDVPEFDNNPFCIVNNNQPFFTANDISNNSFESYSELDYLGRCGTVFACIGKDIMPTQERESIGSVKPSGWQTIKYEFIDGRYLYNRCHLIGYQLSGENANTKNLITGTRYLNVEGMLPFENQVADYVEKTNNHVLYRVTPVFESENLVASGVLLEAYSVEDNGNGLTFCVYCYNVQPGIIINYLNGENYAIDGSAPYGSFDKPAQNKNSQTENPNLSDNNRISYIANKNTKKFHYPDCKSVAAMKESNKQALNCSRDEAVSLGYSPCGNCDP